MELSNDRIKEIDISRGIAIILVVLGHAIISDMTINNEFLYSIRQIIYAIHMPIFFTISGFLFQKNLSKYLEIGKKKYLSKKIKNFIIPYISLSLLDYLIIFVGFKFPFIKDILLKNNFYLPSILDFIKMVLTFINHFDNHLWFLYVMFIILVLNIIFFANRKIDFKIFIFVSFVLYIIGIKYSNFIPEILWKVLKYNFIFIYGRGLSKMKENKYIDIVLTILSILSMISLVIFLHIEIIPLKIIKFFMEITCSYVCVFVLPKFFLKGKIINYLGKNNNSLVIYLFHMSFILLTIIFIFMKLNINVYVTIILSSIFSIILCLFINNIVLAKSNILSSVFLGKKIKERLNNE